MCCENVGDRHVCAGLFEHLGVSSNFLIAQSAHPKTALCDTLDRLELVSSAGFQQSEQRLDNRGGDTASLKVDQWRCRRRASHLGWTLSVVKKVVGVDTNKGDAALV
jgi:hypothetical protein